VTRVLAEQEKQRAATKQLPLASPTLLVLGRTNQIAVIGTDEQVERATALLADMDTALPVQTRIYQFRAASPERIERIAKELVDQRMVKDRYRSVIDKEAGLLIETGPAEVHARIAALKRDWDGVVEQEQSQLRFYKLYNTTPDKVLRTINSLRAAKGGLAPVTMLQMPTAPQLGVMPPPAGSNAPPAAPGEPLPKPPLVKEDRPAAKTKPGAETSRELGLSPPPPSAEDGAAAVVVTADVATNTIIVVASPRIQAMYDQLIRMLTNAGRRC